MVKRHSSHEKKERAVKEEEKGSGALLSKIAAKKPQACE
jgi:hypothetical protein